MASKQAAKGKAVSGKVLKGKAAAPAPKVSRAVKGPQKASPKAKAKMLPAPPGHEDPARLRIRATTMGDLLLTAADRYPNKLALVFPDAEFRYAELAQRALERARGLQAMPTFVIGI